VAKLTAAEYETFIKFMMRTTSENDAEALTALRKANAVLKKQGVTWSDLCRRLVTVISGENPHGPADDEEFGQDRFSRNVEQDYGNLAGSPPPGRKTRDVEREEGARAEVARIDEAFETIETTVNKNSGFWKTLMDYKDQWNTKHFLSPRQKEVLFNATKPRGRR
jgi:hypothetical protein